LTVLHQIAHGRSGVVRAKEKVVSIDQNQFFHADYPAMCNGFVRPEKVFFCRLCDRFLGVPPIDGKQTLQNQRFIQERFLDKKRIQELGVSPR